MAKEFDGIQVGAGFVLQSTEPLDARLQYALLSDMVDVAETSLYDGILAFVVEKRKTYQFDSKNPVDTETGKWREFGGASEAVEASKVTVRETNSDDYAKVYEIYQGPIAVDGDGNDDFESEDTQKNLIGKINIPLDLVVSKGYIAKIVVDTENETAGYYEDNDETKDITVVDYEKYKDERSAIILHIANTEEDRIEIPLSDLNVDMYKAGDNIEISEDNEISVKDVLKQVTSFDDLADGIYQYVGNTDDNYTNGSVYKVETQPDNSILVSLIYPKNQIAIYETVNQLPKNASEKDLAYVRTAQPEGFKNKFSSEELDKVLDRLSNRFILGSRAYKDEAVTFSKVKKDNGKYTIQAEFDSDHLYNYVSEDVVDMFRQTYDDPSIQVGQWLNIAPSHYEVISKLNILSTKNDIYIIAGDNYTSAAIDLLFVEASEDGLYVFDNGEWVTKAKPEDQIKVYENFTYLPAKTKVDTLAYVRNVNPKVFNVNSSLDNFNKAFLLMKDGHGISFNTDRGEYHLIGMESSIDIPSIILYNHDTTYRYISNQEALDRLTSSITDSIAIGDWVDMASGKKVDPPAFKLYTDKITDSDLDQKTMSQVIDLLFEGTGEPAGLYIYTSKAGWVTQDSLTTGHWIGTKEQYEAEKGMISSGTIIIITDSEDKSAIIERIDDDDILALFE